MTRNFKKIAALVLAFAMLASSFAFSSFAVDGVEGGENISVGLALSAESAKPGDVITVTVSISNNYNAAAMRWPVLFSKDFFELVGEDGGITTPIDNVTAAAGSTTTALADDFVPTAYADTHSAFTIQWFAGVTEDKAVAVFNSGVAAEAFTFQLKVKETATGTGSVLIPADSTAFYDMAMLDPTDPLSYYDATELNVTVSDPATVVAGSVAAADPELVAAEGYSVKTIQFDGDDTIYLCGFDVVAVVDNGEDFTDQFAVNNGTYSVSSDTLATGTVVTVYNAAGEVFAEYPIIVFGDTSGDGLIDNLDGSVLYGYLSGEIEPQGDKMINYYACDLFIEDTNSAGVDALDSSAINAVISGEKDLSSINQTHEV